MLERDYQRRLIKKIEDSFPRCLVLKNDPTFRQGVPDLLILFEDKWAMLEVKRSASEAFQANQEYYIDLLNEMSFASAISPEIEEEVLDGLRSKFGHSR